MRSLFSISVLIAATLPLGSRTFKASNNPSATSSGDVQVITVTAKKYEFDPSPIRVKVGTRVQLKITAKDHTHGFSINDILDGSDKAGLAVSTPQGCQKIEEGQTATVEFVAQLPGRYPFRCCVHCGWRHRSMKGELIVEP